MVDVVSRSVGETEAVAAALAADLEPGDVVAVRGELGTGKTTFVRAACRALGVTERVTSPTFTIGHRYKTDRGAVSHLDLYRLERVSPSEWGDLEPYFDGAIVFVEWPDAAAGTFPRPAAEVELEHLGGDARLIRVRASTRALPQGAQPC